jgi:hypothetical protein
MPGLTLPAAGTLSENDAPAPHAAPHVPRRRRLRDAVRRALLGSEERSLRASLHAELTAPHRVRAAQRAAFVGGVFSICLFQHVVLTRPDDFGLLYSALLAPLLVLRAVQFARRKWLLFLVDFCYVVNLVTLAHLWLAPSSAPLFRVAFALANGPLAWAIVLWRNSLVFHSPERLTSLYIHAVPPLVTWVQRWQRWPAPAYLECADCGPPAAPHLFAAPLAVYICWQLFYFLATEHPIPDCSRRRETDGGDGGPRSVLSDELQETSLRWMVRRESGGILVRGALTVARRAGLLAAGEQFAVDSWKTKLVFALVQLAITVATLLLAWPLYFSRELHSAALLLWFAFATFNGSTFYLRAAPTHANSGSVASDE